MTILNINTKILLLSNFTIPYKNSPIKRAYKREPILSTSLTSSVYHSLFNLINMNRVMRYIGINIRKTALHDK